VAIECKNLNRSVELGDVRNFGGVLADIPGLRGIVVTGKGFGRGAKKYAKTHNIGLGSQTLTNGQRHLAGNIWLPDVDSNSDSQLIANRNLKHEAKQRRFSRLSLKGMFPIWWLHPCSLRPPSQEAECANCTCFPRRTERPWTCTVTPWKKEKDHGRRRIC